MPKRKRRRYYSPSASSDDHYQASSISDGDRDGDRDGDGPTTTTTTTTTVQNTSRRSSSSQGWDAAAAAAAAAVDGGDGCATSFDASASASASAATSGEMRVPWSKSSKRMRMKQLKMDATNEGKKRRRPSESNVDDDDDDDDDDEEYDDDPKQEYERKQKEDEKKKKKKKSFDDDDDEHNNHTSRGDVDDVDDVDDLDETLVSTSTDTTTTKTTTTTTNKNKNHKKNKKNANANDNPKLSKRERKRTGTLTRMSSMQRSFRHRLMGSRFRELNEILYTSTSHIAYEKFSERPELYEQYHDGFRLQVKDWPINPVHSIFRWITETYRHDDDRSRGGKGKKNDEQSTIVVADFGCGDAELGRSLLEVNQRRQPKRQSQPKQQQQQQQQNQNQQNQNQQQQRNGRQPTFTVHNFDLVSSCESVTACDMANVPLSDRTVDVAVFCLSLMGTNMADFLREAHRVMKSSGRLKIVEVRSRFEMSSVSSSSSTTTTTGSLASSSRKKGGKKGGEGRRGDDDGGHSVDGIDDFKRVLDRLGFECCSEDRRNKMFVILECVKNGRKPDTKLHYSAKPCIYKRR